MGVRGVHGEGGVLPVDAGDVGEGDGAVGVVLKDVRGLVRGEGGGEAFGSGVEEPVDVLPFVDDPVEGHVGVGEFVHDGGVLPVVEGDEGAGVVGEEFLDDAASVKSLQFLESIIHTPEGPTTTRSSCALREPGHLRSGRMWYPCALNGARRLANWRSAMAAAAKRPDSALARSASRRRRSESALNR